MSEKLLPAPGALPVLFPESSGFSFRDWFDTGAHHFIVGAQPVSDRHTGNSPDPASLNLLSTIWAKSETSSASFVAQSTGFFEGREKSREWQSVVPHSKSLEERLFEALAAAKIVTSKIAMHLDRNWRNKLFEQLDRMHEFSEWEEEDILLSVQSFETFLRSWFLLKPKHNPGLGISVRGNLLAAWVSEERKLTLEFFPLRRVSWLLSITSRESNERAYGLTDLEKVLSRLAPYDASFWFTDDQDSEHRR